MNRRVNLIRGLALATAMAIAAAGCAENRTGGGGGSGSGYPSGAIEFVTAGDAGGGLDIFAREIEKTLQSEGLLKVRMNITNLGGGGGNPAMAIGRQRKGNGNTLIGNSNRVYLNPLLGTTDLKVDKDFVPVAQLMTEYVVLAVRADSPYNSGKELMAALAKNPRALALGVGTVPSDDQLHLLRVGDATGVDVRQLNIVAFRAGGDLMTQLLGGHVGAISTGLSEALPQYKAGKIKILAISAPERVKGDAEKIPTWKEQGVDVVVDHWRGVFGPADMPKEAQDFWQETFAKMVKTDAWAKVLERNEWAPLYRDSEEFGQVLREESETAQRLLRQVGLVKQ